MFLINLWYFEPEIDGWKDITDILNQEVCVFRCLTQGSFTLTTP